MKICTFFGHRQVYDTAQLTSKLFDTILELIETRGVNLFFVGDSGSFDHLVLKVLRGLKKLYPQIEYYVVLSYLRPKSEYCLYTEKETIFPDIMTTAHPRYAIVKRNNWMLDSSDIVITYINTYCGGAAAFAQKAEKKGMEIIKLGIL